MGEVDDVMEEVVRFDVSVAPLSIARGVQNKVLEAMAAARPVVLSPRAADGIAARDGEEFGPFQVRGIRREPGSYQTRHIFTEAGEYGSVLSFRKGDEETVHTVDFTFNINDRSDLEIPKRGGGAHH